ncbi:MAG: hypothetical protein B6I24_09410 [Bacteroidetes bacterium 4572_128]|nr:MAG: hypothetical protein B6I24_09410 [Bacteroidetes bacterium 4572_128]
MNKLKIDFKLSEFTGQRIEAKAKDYILTPELQSAVKVAIALGQPLLITGEPGTGKTRLAHKVAYDLSQNNENLIEKPFVFNTKTNSVASDLFYTYDAIKHFHDANIKHKNENCHLDTSKYITLQALGKAIAFASDDESIKEKYLEEKIKHPQSSVVLIDEIDKAPRDFSNDILNEIENYQFTIKETDETIKKSSEEKIIVILTSNSEKNLPDAFLRRCVFFHLPFPKKDELIEIIKLHLGDTSKYAKDVFVDYFLEVRENMLKKKPATAEFISWLKVLELEKFIENDENIDFDNLTKKQENILKISYSLLAKTEEDLKENTNF